jgi:hypothetical protein
MKSIQDRLEQLEDRQRFIEWFVCERFLESFTREQINAMAYDGRLPEPLPEPLPKGKSGLDRLDRKSLVKLWEEQDRIFRHRSPDEMTFFNEHGYWPEQRMRPRYYLQDGCLCVEWHLQPEGDQHENK